MLATNVTLTRDMVIHLARITLKPTKCDWAGCSAILNSWLALKKHQHLHCKQTAQQGDIHCQIPRCSGPYHKSLQALTNHVDMSHLNHTQLLCPIKDCPETFTRSNYLVSHFEAVHNILVDREVHGGAVLKLSSSPHRHLPQTVPPLPPSCSSDQIDLTNLKLTRKKPQPMSEPVPTLPPDGQPENKEESTAIVFDDLPKRAWRQSGERTAPIDAFFHVQRKPPPSQPQLSFPPPVVHKQTVQPDPPRTFLYDTFSLRYDELDKQGLVDGRGVWPKGLGWKGP